MRAYLPAYDVKALNFATTLRLLHREPGIWRPFAGGTDLMVLLEAGVLPPGKFLSLGHLSELRGIRTRSHYVELGSMTTYSEIRHHPLMNKEYPCLVRAAAETGAIGIQNRGTLGGNIANASPAADTPPGLLVYDAEIELVSSRGSRWVPYASFHTGYKKTEMKPEELIRSVRLPRSKINKAFHYYRKVGTRRAQAISKVCLAGKIVADVSGRILQIRLALGSVAPVPIRCVRTERGLEGAKLNAETIRLAQANLREEISPIDDIRSNRDYRTRVALNLLCEFLEGFRV